MTGQDSNGAAIVLAGVPASNNWLYHRIRFSVGDPAVWLSLPEGGGRATTLIIRDIEMDRAKRHARADRVACPADFAPDGGLSGDRETATAQAAAECLRRAGVRRAIADRSLPLIFAHMIQAAGIELDCDTELGVMERRAKDEQEIESLREAQEVTEGAVRMACELIAGADAGRGGVLTYKGEPLTAERVRTGIDVWLLGRGFTNPNGSIVAGGPQGADCHDYGSGELRTGEPVIIDIFPRSRQTRYHGDCTRTVVHGDVPGELAKMHAVVLEAKSEAIAATRAGATGESVHRAAVSTITGYGYSTGLPPEDADDSWCSMTHGTGHGIGLDVHEPPLLDVGGPKLIVGDALTVEPGLYCKAIGGIRVEDMVIVTASGCENLNSLHSGLVWR